MEAFNLLRDLTLAMAAALAAGLLCLRLKQPALVGYLLAGVLIGPHGLGLVRDEASIARLADVGVILLMFALGVEFSIAQFRPYRWLVLMGGGLFIGLITVGTAGINAAFGFPIGRGVLWGFIFALSSTIIVMRLLMDRHEVDSPHGKTMLGWLILQDIAVVPMLVAIPVLRDPAHALGLPLLWAMLKVALFLAVMVLIGTRLFPLFLHRIAYERQKELFFLGVVTLCFGTAALSAALGLSISLGAFLAGLVVSQSDEHHQVLAEMLPLRDLFVTLFFVSVGMLIDPAFVSAHAQALAGLVALVIVGKALLGTAIARALKLSWRASLLIGFGLAQIGEFSFVLAKEGQVQGLLSEDFFSMTLTAALATMLLTPMLMQFSSRLSAWVAHAYHAPGEEPAHLHEAWHSLKNHVVIAGYGRVGQPLGEILHHRGEPLLVIDLDRRLLKRLRTQGIETLYGDAAMHEVLSHAALASARLLVVALPDPETALLTVEHAHALAPELEIIVRVQRVTDMERFYELGVCEVVLPEVEAGRELIRSTLSRLEWPPHVIYSYLVHLRNRQHHPLAELFDEEPPEALTLPPLSSETAWLSLPENSALAGKSLAQADLAGRTGAQVLVLKRLEDHIVHPPPDHLLQTGDSLLVLGTPEQLEEVLRVLSLPKSGQTSYRG